MILNPKQTSIAYRCNVCGQGVKSVVGVFSLTGERMKLKCPCGESSLTIDRMKNDKYTITVPCALCGDDHRFTISSSAFFDKDIFVYPCAYTGVGACFLGTPENVEKALDENEKEVIELCKSVGLDDPREMFSALNAAADKEDDFDERDCDPDVLDTLSFVIGDLLEDGEIECKCQNLDLDSALCRGYVKLFCKNCSASADIPVRGRNDADVILEMSKIVLK